MAVNTRSALRSVSRQRGFILVATLWLLALLTVAASYLAYWTTEAVDNAWREQQAWRAELEMRSTEAAFLYLFSTRRLNVAGLTLEPPDLTSLTVDDFDNPSFLLPTGNELTLDDRRYQGLGHAAFTAQDESGLVTLTHPDRTQLGRLLGLIGVSAAQRDPLFDKLQDYSDSDDLTRLNGGEARQYQESDLPAPPNRELLTSWEAHAILDWSGYEDLWRNQRLPRLTTILYTGLPNPNTAPLLNLQTIPGVDAETARRIVAGRPYLSYYALNIAIGVPLPVDDLRFLASVYIRLTLSHPDWPGRREIRLRATPQSTSRPWLIDYVLDFPADDDPTASPPTPVASPVFAEAPAAPPERTR
ncbi:MAG: general secretion pathway protein GspK [Gammaproteobacteria bacterium]|nr:general secretion pathway protein GspK [Gammaproteobacteria bacterium]